MTRASTAIDAGSTSGFGEPAGDDVDDRLGAAVGIVLDDAQRPGVASLCAPGDDLLGDAPFVVAEQGRPPP